MGIRKISHVAIAVRDLEQQIAFYRDTLGFELVTVEEVESQKVKAALLRVGDSIIELLEPTDPEGAVGKFLQKRGPGLHHVSYEVDDLPGVLARLKQQGIRLVDEKPRPGAHQTEIAFVHPRATGGVLIELSTPSAAPDEDHD